MLVPLDGGAEPAGGADPAEGLQAGRVLAVVERALAAMKPELAEVFRWRTATARSFQEIA